MDAPTIICSPHTVEAKAPAPISQQNGRWTNLPPAISLPPGKSTHEMKMSNESHGSCESARARAAAAKRTRTRARPKSPTQRTAAKLTRQVGNAVWRQGGLSDGQQARRSSLTTQIPAVRTPATYVASVVRRFERKDLIDDVDAKAADAREPSYPELVELDASRKRLLSISRNISPIDSIFKLSILHRTVFPRVHRRIVTWVVYAVFAVSSILCRMGIYVVHDANDGIIDAGATVITFMIIFYMGYARACMHACPAYTCVHG